MEAAGWVLFFLVLLILVCYLAPEPSNSKGGWKWWKRGWGKDEDDWREK